MITAETIASLENTDLKRKFGFGLIKAADLIQHKKIIEAVNEVSQKLGVSNTDVVVHNGDLAGICYDHVEDCIVLHEKIAAILSHNELCFAIAHELDHKSRSSEFFKLCTPSINDMLRLANEEAIRPVAENTVSLNIAQSETSGTIDNLEQRKIITETDRLEAAADDRGVALYGPKAALFAVIKLTSNTGRKDVLKSILDQLPKGRYQETVAKKLLSVAQGKKEIPASDLSERLPERLRGFYKQIPAQER